MPPVHKKKKLQRITLMTLLFITIAAGSLMMYEWFQYRKARFARYTEFGINIPLGYTIHGIDVSKYQSTIAWQEVKAMQVKDVHLQFAFIKATEGTVNTDPQFNRNWKKAKEAGLFRGAYHFFIASRDGKLQAENFIGQVEKEKGDLRPVLDIEQLNGTTPEAMRQEAKVWLDIVEEKFGVKPIIYTNVDFYKSYLGEEFDDYPFWAAHYHHPGEPRTERDWAFWQHSDQGRVNGIVSKVDFNVFNGDLLAFRRLLIR